MEESNEVYIKAVDDEVLVGVSDRHVVITGSVTMSTYDQVEFVLALNDLLLSFNENVELKTGRVSEVLEDE